MTFIDTVIHGDALEQLRTLPDNSIDSLVCDPPAGISFMLSRERQWDSDKGGRKQWIAWLASIMQEVYRVLRPGAHGLVWSLPRTSHWTGDALEDAGFEIRDSIYHLYSKHDKLQSFMASLSDGQRAEFEQLIEDDPIRLHLFGSGFPKSLDVSKQLDKLSGVERTETEMYDRYHDGLMRIEQPSSANISFGCHAHSNIRTKPATEAAKRAQGTGSALKPACEQWWLIRKPLGESSIAANVLKWGCGAINIDASRIGNDVSRGDRYNGKAPGGQIFKKSNSAIDEKWNIPPGRFPSHLLLSHSLFCSDEQCVPECPVAVLDAQSGTRKSGGRVSHTGEFQKRNITGNGTQTHEYTLHPSEGGASRYFAQFRPDAPPFIYASKASRRERNAGCEALPVKMKLRSDLTPEQRDYVMKELAKIGVVS